MQVIVQSKTLAVTAALRSFIQEQAQKLFRHGQQINSVTVFLESIKPKKKQDLGMCVKFCIEVPGKTIVVKKKAADMYDAIAAAARRSGRYLRKRQEKRRDHQRMGVDWSIFGSSRGWAI